MRLKSLELYGFKSFAEKTTLTFDENFAAIVGPNGSGKSNLSDAVRWVLGEQSARLLRGEKMEDVIFSGASRKSAMNLAQVDLTFDNTDASIPLPYETITVSRKVYRNGDSQYLLNRQPVRRKDVVELFLDTGVGKEGYSIIGQGRIDEILSTKSEDRRAVFEEAAGIAKFKFKKTESERRLAATESQLEEVSGDLKIREQEWHLLEKQANQAKEGMRLVRELDQHELSLLEQERKKGKQAQQKIAADLQQQEALEKETQEKLTQIKEALLPYEAFQITYQEQMEQLRASLLQIDQGRQKQETARRVAEEQLSIYSQSEARLQEEQEKRKAQMEERSSRQHILEKDCKDLQAKEDALRMRMTEFSDSPSRQEEGSSLLEEARSRLQTAQESLTLFHYRQENEKAQDQKLREEQANQQTLHRQKEEESEKIQKEIEKKQDDESALMEQGKSLVQEMEIQEKQMQALESKRRELEEEHRQLFSERATLTSRASMLQNWMAQYEGYGRSVQNLLKLSDRDEDVKARMIGPLADLIRVREGYEMAIHVSLGGALQNIVVRSEQDAKYLIQVLKQRQLGRVTFLPLDKIRGSVPERSDAPEELMNGVDAVEYPPELKDIITHFLAHTSLVKTIDDAIQLSHRRNFRNRIVSLDGDIVNSWGSMVGGKRREDKDTTLINRESELVHLREEIQKIHAKMLAIEEEQKESETSALAIQQQQKERNLKIGHARETLMRVQKELLTLKMQKEQVAKELTQLEVLLSKSSAYDPTSFLAQEDQLKQEVVLAQRALDEAEMQREESLRKQQEKERDYALLSNQLSYVVREREIAENRLAESQEQQELLQEQQKQGEQQLYEARQILKTAKTTLTESIKAMETQEIAKKKQEADMRDLQTNAQEQNEVLHRLQEMENNLEENLREIQNVLYRLRVQAEQLSKQDQELLENYRSAHDLSFEMVEARLQELVPVTTSKQQVNEIRQQLSRIGYFNVETIDQFAEVSKEVEFLKNQLSDLQQSEANIRELIRDLDQTMQEMFASSFRQVQKEYNRIFQVLFHGGHANLRLDGEDVLTAGVEIEAQPPGKKLQSLNLLSGGERSMTALALLFAIFSIHPTPFCILDEIDAALDEANIGRYVEYLKTLRDVTQFIIITHRKTTMQLAETLYGVTMQEGVSHIVTLRLSEYEESTSKEQAAI